ncbi:MAG: oligosaccharide flippase family protein [Gemmatimonadetes bacterium]|nr:oligosaccharide flippase family protein [Gemmatimonadota bacterium]
MTETSAGLAGGIRRLLRPILPPGMSLTQRALRAGFWSVVLRSVLRSIGFVRNVVLARLLAPDDFGLFGIALVVLSILSRFSSTGLETVLVQKKVILSS